MRSRTSREPSPVSRLVLPTDLLGRPRALPDAALVVDPANPFALIFYAVALHPGHARAIPLLPLLQGSIRRGGAGGNEPRATLRLPADVAANIEGAEEERDVYLVVHIDRKVYDEVVEKWGEGEEGREEEEEMAASNGNGKAGE